MLAQRREHHREERHMASPFRSDELDAYIRRLKNVKQRNEWSSG
jgi:hypothetical protein